MLDGLLPGDDDERHTPEACIGHGGDEIGGTGAEGREAYAGASRESAVGGCHEARRLFVAGEYEPDGRGTQGLEKGEILLAGDAEDMVDALCFETADEKRGGVHACSLLRHGYEEAIPSYAHRVHALSMWRSRFERSW